MRISKRKGDERGDEENRGGGERGSTRGKDGELRRGAEDVAMDLLPTRLVRYVKLLLYIKYNYYHIW